MDNDNQSFLHVLVDAKSEYTQQLTQILSSPIYEGISSIYKHSKNISKNQETILQTFQELLSKIPKWTNETLNEEYTRIVLYSKCDWIADLITAVFISHTKVLTSIHLGSKQRNIDLKIPTPNIFIHNVYINVAREFWKNPYLFYNENLNPIDVQRNMRDSENIIQECIKNTIRKLLPVKHIIKEYLGEDCQESIATEDITSKFSNIHNDKLKQMAKLDLHNINIENQENDYTNNINDEDTQSVVSIRTIKEHTIDNKKISLEDVISSNVSKKSKDLEKNFNDYIPDNNNIVVPPKSMKKINDETVSQISSTSSVRQLKLIRSMDRPRKHIIPEEILEDQDNSSYF